MVGVHIVSRLNEFSDEFSDRPARRSKMRLFSVY